MSDKSGVVENSNFQHFRWLFLWKLEMKPSLLHSDMHSIVGFSAIPKCVTLNDYFAFLCRFAWLLTVWLFENNCVKTNEDRHILSAVQIFGRDSSYWQHKVCADIRTGSVEKRRQRTVGSHVNTRLEQLFLAFENYYVKINTDRPIL